MYIDHHCKPVVWPVWPQVVGASNLTPKKNILRRAVFLVGSVLRPFFLAGVGFCTSTQTLKFKVLDLYQFSKLCEFLFGQCK